MQPSRRWLRPFRVKTWGEKFIPPLAPSERPTHGEPYDETDISRAYVSRIPAEKLKVYDRDWSDDQVIDWDGNFRDDGDLMLVCVERDVEVVEFRRVVEEFIEYRRRHPE